MNNIQPVLSPETLSHGETFPTMLVPRLSLPQVASAQEKAVQQHSSGTLLQQVLPQQAVPFLQTPVTPPLIEPLTLQSPVRQVPFSTPRLDLSRSLRSGITYIPASMQRHNEPGIADALVACATLIVIALLLLMLLYYFSV